MATVQDIEIRDSAARTAAAAEELQDVQGERHWESCCCRTRRNCPWRHRTRSGYQIKKTKRDPRHPRMVHEYFDAPRLYPGNL